MSLNQQYRELCAAYHSCKNPYEKAALAKKLQQMRAIGTYK